MSSKTYVCGWCLGTGEVELFCDDDDCDHQNEGCTEGRAGPCPTCVKRGFPPTVTASKPGGASDVVVQVNQPVEKKEQP